MNKLSVTAVLISMVMLFSACAKEKKADLIGRVTFTAGEVKINGKDCNFGDIVKGNDEVTTGEKSLAVIQFGESSVINLNEKTTLVIEALLSDKGQDTITLNQKSGSTFNKIVKSGTNYALKSKTAVAGVRGTTFSMVTGETGATIKLSTGYVKIVPVYKGVPAEEKSLTLSEGNKLEVKDTTPEAAVELKPEVLTTAESTELKELNKISLLPDIKDEKKIEAIKQQKEEERVVIIPVEIVKAAVEAPAEEKPLTLKEIQKKFGAISVINTTDGKEYTGAFVQEGAVVRVHTVNGVVKIPSDKISNVSKYRGNL